MQSRCLKNLQGREPRANNAKQVEFKVTHVGSSGLAHSDIKIARKESKFGRFLWDYFGEHALICRAERESSYDGGLLLLLSTLSKPSFAGLPHLCGSPLDSP